ncbi:hypothetical protein ABVT39_026435 [Epinephelus coioides]
MFYLKRPGGLQTRVPPVETGNSCLSDSVDSDEDYTPTPGDENGSNTGVMKAAVVRVLTTGAAVMKTPMEIVMHFRAAVFKVKILSSVSHWIVKVGVIIRTLKIIVWYQ